MPTANQYDLKRRHIALGLEIGPRLWTNHAIVSNIFYYLVRDETKVPLSHFRGDKRKHKITITPLRRGAAEVRVGSVKKSLLFTALDLKIIILQKNLIEHVTRVNDILAWKIT